MGIANWVTPDDSPLAVHILRNDFADRIDHIGSAPAVHVDILLGVVDRSYQHIGSADTLVGYSRTDRHTMVVEEVHNLLAVDSPLAVDSRPGHSLAVVDIAGRSPVVGNHLDYSRRDQTWLGGGISKSRVVRK